MKIWPTHFSNHRLDPTASLGSMEKASSGAHVPSSSSAPTFPPRAVAAASLQKKTASRKRSRRGGKGASADPHGSSAVDWFVVMPWVSPSSSTTPTSRPKPPPAAGKEETGQHGEEFAFWTHTTVAQRLLLETIVSRLCESGFREIALTHTIYGRAHFPQDQAHVTIPDALIEHLQQYALTTTRPSMTLSSCSSCALRIYRRLHAVVENVSDVGYYTSPPAGPATHPAAAAPTATAKLNKNHHPHRDPPSSPLALLDAYDLVSLAPRNEAAFQAACRGNGSGQSGTTSTTNSSNNNNNTHSRVDIITLDYYSTGGSGRYLPYTIRSADVQAARQGGLVLEIPHGPALVNKSLRQGWIQASREVQQQAGRYGPHTTPWLLASSGPRGMRSSTASRAALDPGSDDVGALALRMPGDIINLLHTVLRWPPNMATHAVTTAGRQALQQAQKRRWGSSSLSVTIDFQLGADRGPDQPAHGQNTAAAAGRNAATDGKPPSKRRIAPDMDEEEEEEEESDDHDHGEKPVELPEQGEEEEAADDGFIAF